MYQELMVKLGLDDSNLKKNVFRKLSKNFWKNIFKI